MTESSSPVSSRAQSFAGLRSIIKASTTLLTHRDLRAVVVCSMLLGLSVSFVMPFMSMFGTLEVGMSLTTFGLFMTVVAVVNILISTTLAVRSDTTHSRRRMLLLASAAGALGYFGYAWVRDFWTLMVIGSLALGVASLTFSQVLAHARELVDRADIPVTDAPLYMSAVRMCFALSWTVGPALAAVTLQAFSFTGLFVVASLTHVLVFVVVLLFLPKTRAPALTAEATAPTQLPLRRFLSDKSVLAWFIAFGLVSAAHTISMSNMSLLVLNTLGGTEPQIGIIFGLAPVFELPLMLYFGLLATRMASPPLIRGAFGVAVVYYALLSVVGAPWHIYPLQLLSAAVISITGGVAISFFQDKLPGFPGAATSLYFSATRAGSTSGYLMFGTIASTFGHRGAYVACCGLVAAALMLTLTLGRD